MHDIYSIVSVVLFASPIVVGVGAYFGIWFRDEFWKDQLYNYED